MKRCNAELSVLEAAIAEDHAAKAEALQHGLLANQPLSLVNLSALCALGDRMIKAARRIEQAETLPPRATVKAPAVDAPVRPSSLFRYLIAHSHDAVSPDNRAMHPKPRQDDDLDLEYRRFDASFRDYFNNWPGIKASLESAADGIAIELQVVGGTKASVEIIIEHFLGRFNRAWPGVAFVSRPR